MKQSLLFYNCDQCRDEDSPHAATWAEAKKQARKAGWEIGRRYLEGPADTDRCPSCKAHPEAA